jgi:undecaprenyl-diphosphatase
MNKPEGVVERPMNRLLTRIDRRILIGFLAFVLVAVGFLKFAGEVGEGETAGFDRWLLEALRVPGHPELPIGPHWLAQAMTDITALGGYTVLSLLVLLTTGYLVAAGKSRNAGFMLAAIVSGVVLGILLKAIFVRPRPDIVDHLVSVATPSFPSGHAMNSAIIYLTLGALLARAQTRRRVRAYIVAAAVLLTFVVGCSRVFLGVHWPTDVAAGWVVGTAWALLCSMLVGTFQRRGAVEAPGDEGEAPGSETDPPSARA